MVYIYYSLISLLQIYYTCIILYVYVDVLSNRKMLNMLLTNRGYQSITQCVNGKEALDLIINDKGIDYFDIIFLDNIMPIMVIYTIYKYI